MYIQTYATLFNSKLEGTDKVIIKNLSVSEKKQDGTYENETWTARFVGAAKDLVATLPEKTRLKVSGNVHNGYNKEKGVNYPYLFITKAEVVPSKNEAAEDAIENW